MPVLKRKLAIRAAVLGLCILTLGATLLWGSLVSTPLEGRYVSTGQVQLSTGEVVDVNTTFLFVDGRVYVMSRQGAAVLELSGSLTRGFMGGYRLQISKGEVNGLTPDWESDLLFHLLYSRTAGAVINLEPFRGCLFALETRQLYCPELDESA